MFKLSDKENKIIELIGKGLQNGEIADRLGLTRGTVGQYIHNLCRVTGARNRIELYNMLK